MSDEKWIPTSNMLFKEGIPKDKLTLLVGQSAVGNSYLYKIQKSWIRAQNRKETIKKVFI